MNPMSCDHSAPLNPFLRHLLPPRQHGQPIYWHGTRLRTFTPAGESHDTPVTAHAVANWYQRHGFPGLLAEWSTHLRGQRFLVEHTGVNPVHPLHAGSLRGSLIGNFLVNALTSAGAGVSAHYFVNDLGRQTRMLSWILERTHRERLPQHLRFDHAAAVLYALVNMFHAHRTSDIARLHTEHPWLAEAITLTSGDHDHLTHRLAEEQPPDAILVRRMLDAALHDLSTLGATIDTVEYESSLPHTPGLPLDIAEHAPVTTVNGTLCLRLPGGLIPMTRPDGSWLYFSRDVANTRRQATCAPNVLHVIGSDQDHFQRGLRHLVPDTAIEHVGFGTVTRDGKRFSARQNRLLTLHDIREQDGPHALWSLALLILGRNRTQPVDLTPHRTPRLAVILRAQAAVNTGIGIDRHTTAHDRHAWPLVSALLRTPEALRRCLHQRSPHPATLFLQHTSQLYLRAVQHQQVAPWMWEFFRSTQHFLADLHGLPLDDLARSGQRQDQELA